MLSQYLESESRRWAAQQQSYPASFASSLDEDDTSSNLSESDAASIFSSTRSRRSSISSVASDDEGVAAAPAFQQPTDSGGNPITVYASLDQAVAQSNQRIEAESPRRLVTPGKLYENEEDDDEIVEVDQGEELVQQHPAAAIHGYGYPAATVLAVG